MSIKIADLTDPVVISLIKKYRILLGGCFIGVVLLLFYLTFLWVPKYLANVAKYLTIKDQFHLFFEAIKSVGILGGFFLVYFTWKRLEVAQESQITERFSKAIEQLGETDSENKPKMEIRLGAIHALGRIARDSERDHWPIMEILTAYVRRNSPFNKEKDSLFKEITEDIQAVMNVINRREFFYGNGEDDVLNLQDCNLREVSLFKVHLERARLYGANLNGAILRGAILKGALLSGAHLERAGLWGADLERADLGGAHLGGANLSGAHLKGANLGGAHLRWTEFEGANLEGAKLNEADLIYTRCSAKQLINTETLYNAKLPSELEKEIRDMEYDHLLDEMPSFY